MDNNYSLDYLLNYCEDSNIPLTDVRVSVQDQELLADLHNYETMTKNKEEVIYEN